MNDENLKRSREKTQFCGENAVRNAQKSHAVPRRTRAITEVIKSIGAPSQHGGEPTKLESLEDTRETGVNLTVDDIIVLKLVEKAAKGDLKAIELYLRMRGGEFVGKDIERAAAVAKMRAETKAIKETNPVEAQGAVVIVDNIPDAQEGETP